MKNYELFYATNRKHKGNNRWNPKGYGINFSGDGMENLRYGKVTVSAKSKEVDKYVKKKISFGNGDGGGLTGYFSKHVDTAQIEAFSESFDSNTPDSQQSPDKLGSNHAFKELQDRMLKSKDILIYIHGFNVSWEEAVSSALALQAVLNNGSKNIMVFLFTWPSDGKALPYVSYKSDRSDAEASGYAFGRGMLKLRDFLMKLRNRTKPASLMNGIKKSKFRCNQEIHLLCHSMGNYVLQNFLSRMIQFNTGSVLPRIFEHIFLCAPDVDDNILEPGQQMEKLHELSRSVSIYHNKGDLAMNVSDYTKGNPERLGVAGAAKPALLHNKINQIDCTPIVDGFVEHSYYLDGRVNSDIRQSIEGVAYDDKKRNRVQISNTWPNIWKMK